MRAALLKKLPDYKVPAAYCILESFPLTGNGKVDRKGLPPLKGLRPEWLPEPVPPQGDTQTGLARLWSRLLDVEPVGSRDDFFDLGGHSLAAGQLLTAIRADLQVEIPLQKIYQNPVLADLAAAIDHRADEGGPLEPERSLEKKLKYLEGF
jgi:acyl carrier protein